MGDRVERINRHGGGLAAWSIRHPVGVSLIALAVIVLGLFTFGRLAVDLLPQLIYPEVEVRVADPGTPAPIIEDRITRPLEEQLAITEDAIAIQSNSNEGRSSISLSFSYGKDIDRALQDASIRLDRARRFLPDSSEQPVIFKRDPSQIPVVEYVVSSSERDPVALRSYMDYQFANQLLNLPGVAAVEIGGGLQREIQVIPDLYRLAAFGLDYDDLLQAIRDGNRDAAAGRLTTPNQQISSRVAGRLDTLQALRELPIQLPGSTTIPLAQIAEVRDSHADERLRVQLDGRSGVRMSIQKQPDANTVAVVAAVEQRLAQLRESGRLPADLHISTVDNQSIYIKNALNNATLAAILGTLLAMSIVYLFLGNLRRTLLIGTAIPLAIMVTFVLMGLTGLTFNIMTLGGLALGVGMLVDNTIVMLENIQRHQQQGEGDLEAGEHAAAEINSAIVAATSTNLAAVLPFLFIGGLVGLLFQELIFTISAAILASMVVALTLVPALGVRIHDQRKSRLRQGFDRLLHHLQNGYQRLVEGLLRRPLLQLAYLALLLGGGLWAGQLLIYGQQVFLPDMDGGFVNARINADVGTTLEEMQQRVDQITALLQQQPEVVAISATVGGAIFGRTEVERSNLSQLKIQLVPITQRQLSSQQWAAKMNRLLAEQGLVGIRIRLSAQGIRGIRVGRGSEDINLRVSGPDLEQLRQIGDEIVERLRPLPLLTNLSHIYEEVAQELSIQIDRERAAELNLDPGEIGRLIRLALSGEVAGEFLDADRGFDIRLRLTRHTINSPAALEQLLLPLESGVVVHLGDLAQLRLQAAPSSILRDRQQRTVAISATLAPGATVAEVYRAVDTLLADYSLPPGYERYSGDELEALQAANRLGVILLLLAIFLVFVVMGVQYESLRNPLVILFSIPFTVIGVALGLTLTATPLSMPVWLGLIMLAGIVVNNAIVLVEYMDLARARGLPLQQAISEAARLRLRPVLMTTLTTVMGMMPLAIGMGQGSEMLQPLAIALVSGLSLSLLITLLLIPMVYQLFHRSSAKPRSVVTEPKGAVQDAG